jgi:hypothetical protein
MLKTAAACAATAAIVIAFTPTPGTARHDVASAQSYSPPCPQASYGVDGTMGPIFCVVDNPVALRYYAKGGSHLLSLGPNATPQQVTTAGVTDYRHSTEPILCETYRLAAWREHWQFGISVSDAIGLKLHFPLDWCSEPNFSRIGG